MPRILIIDDDRLIRWSLVELFTSLKCEVMEAESRNTAETKLKETDFDLIITDLEMNDTSGSDFIGYIGKEQPEAKIIVLTASEDTKITEGLSSVIKIIDKPYDAENIKSTALSVLNISKKTRR